MIEDSFSLMRKSTLLLICLVISLAVFSAPAKAQSVLARDGNLFIKNKLGQTKKLTTSGRDSQPSLSPDGRRIAFVRGTPGQTVQTSLGKAEANELWLIDSDGEQPGRLVSAKEDNEPKNTLADLSSPQFSPDGHRVYFLSSAWVTSLAVHVVDIQSKVERFISPGSTIDVIQKGKYRGYLIVQMHKYFFGKRRGSYDHFWLLTPKGNEIRRIGAENSYRKFKRQMT
jgi:dipeptidyl aminopeptidase/acylaminoacyl peptidase